MLFIFFDHCLDEERPVLIHEFSRGGGGPRLLRVIFRIHCEQLLRAALLAISPAVCVLEEVEEIHCLDHIVVLGPVVLRRPYLEPAGLPESPYRVAAIVELAVRVSCDILYFDLG